MKLLLYRGGCASKTVHGIKFTQYVRTANVSDEVANKFKGMTDFNIIDIKKTDIIDSTKKDQDDDNDSENDLDNGTDTNSTEVEDTEEEADEEEDEELDKETPVDENPDIDESKVKKFMKLNADTLREMCEAKGLDSLGTKKELATRLSSN